MAQISQATVSTKGVSDRISGLLELRGLKV